MLTNKLLIPLFGLLFLLQSCIEEYVPKEINTDFGTIAIYGKVSNLLEEQEIYIQRSSNIFLNKIEPIEWATVVIEHQQSGQEFSAYAVDASTYKCKVDTTLLKPGNAFRVRAIVGDGATGEREYCSEYSTMIDAAPISDIHAKIEERKGYGEEEDQIGVQFYTNFDGTGNDANFYKWEVIETWDYSVPYPIQFYYDNGLHQLSVPDYSLKTCYVHKPVDQTFTLSLQQLQSKQFMNYPLHYVNNQTSRVQGKYRIKVRQFALTDEAYYYWKAIEENSSERGGLYDTQPYSINGNICSVSNPDEKTLGFFEAVYGQERVINYEDGFDLGSFYEMSCTPGEVDWRMIRDAYDEWPIYFYADYSGGTTMPTLQTASRFCFICTMLGGTTNKPKDW